MLPPWLVTVTSPIKADVKRKYKGGDNLIKVLCYFNENQREWLDKNSVDRGKKARGLAKGKTQSEHIRDAMDFYIKNYGK